MTTRTSLPSRTAPTAPPLQALRDRLGADGDDARKVLAFAAIGVVSTLAYLVLYALLRLAASPALANGVALVVTAVGNTAANRRVTFQVRGRDGLARDHLAGLIAFAVALAITSLSLAVLARIAPAAGRPVEIAVLVVANGLATLVRFLLLRRTLDRDRRHVPDGSHGRSRVPPAMLEGPSR